MLHVVAWCRSSPPAGDQSIETSQIELTRMIFGAVLFLPRHWHWRSRCWADFPAPSSGPAGSHYPPNSGSPWETGLGQGRCLWSSPACCHQCYWGKQKTDVLFCITFQQEPCESYRWSPVETWDGGHLHTIPGSQVFVYDLPASQVAHSTSYLDGHVHQVLLGDRLKGNKWEGRVERPKQEKTRKAQLTWLNCAEVCPQWKQNGPALRALSESPTLKTVACCVLGATEGFADNGWASRCVWEHSQHCRGKDPWLVPVNN